MKLSLRALVEAAKRKLSRTPPPLLCDQPARPTYEDFPHHIFEDARCIFCKRSRDADPYCPGVDAAAIAAEAEEDVA